jgi:hypothetical protein
MHADACIPSARDVSPLRHCIPQPPPPVKLFSKDETFFDYFRQLAEHIGSAASLLKTLLEKPSDAVRIANEIKRVETKGDAIVHVINQRIDTSFVTPLDREDIHQLAAADNVIDIINGAARRVVMFRVTDPGGRRADGRVIVKASDLRRSSTSRSQAHGRAQPRDRCSGGGRRAVRRMRRVAVRGRAAGDRGKVGRFDASSTRSMSVMTSELLEHRLKNS